MTPMERKLEAVRQAALIYLNEKRPEKWDVHVEELVDAPFIELDEEYRLGNWIWDNDDNTLLRDAELQALVLRYGMRFKRLRDQQFVVSSEYWERESFDIEDGFE